MNLTKVFIRVSAAIVVILISWSAWGGEPVPSTCFPGETLFHNAFAKILCTFGQGEKTASLTRKASPYPFIKIAMDRVSGESPAALYPPASLLAYEIKSGGGGLLIIQNPFRGYFWGISGKVRNTTGLDLAYNFGSLIPHIYFGYDDVWCQPRLQGGR